MQGHLPLSHCHFTGVVALKKPGHPAKVVMECLLDTGRAKTMIDLGTSRKAGLPLVYPMK